MSFITDNVLHILKKRVSANSHVLERQIQTAFSKIKQSQKEEKCIIENDTVQYCQQENKLRIKNANFIEEKYKAEIKRINDEWWVKFKKIKKQKSKLEKLNKQFEKQNKVLMEKVIELEEQAQKINKEIVIQKIVQIPANIETNKQSIGEQFIDQQTKEEDSGEKQRGEEILQIEQLKIRPKLQIHSGLLSDRSMDHYQKRLFSHFHGEGLQSFENEGNNKYFQEDNKQILIQSETQCLKQTIFQLASELEQRKMENAENDSKLIEQEQEIQKMYEITKSQEKQLRKLQQSKNMQENSYQQRIKSMKEEFQEQKNQLNLKLAELTVKNEKYIKQITQLSKKMTKKEKNQWEENCQIQKNNQHFLEQIQDYRIENSNLSNIIASLNNCMKEEEAITQNLALKIQKLEDEKLILKKQLQQAQFRQQASNQKINMLSFMLEDMNIPRKEKPV